jgi:hypothetical protein
LSGNIIESLAKVGIPVSGGPGFTEEAPIVVTACALEDAAYAVLAVPRAIAAQSECAWRLMSAKALDPDGTMLKLSIEAAFVTAEKPSSEPKFLFFRLPKGLAHFLSDLDTVTCVREEGTGYEWPYQLGFAHYEGHTDNTATEPGLGVSIAYGMPETDTTIYIYDKGRSDVPDGIANSIVQSEFNAALRDIAMVKVSAQLVSRGDLQEGVDWPLVVAHLKIDGANSLLAVTGRGGKFVKLRATWKPERAIEALVRPTLEDFTRHLRHPIRTGAIVN